MFLNSGPVRSEPWTQVQILAPLAVKLSVRMDIMIASRSSIPFLVLLSIAKAAKLDDKSLYHVVEDLPGIETQRPGKELVATCSEIMAQNGQITSH